MLQNIASSSVVSFIPFACLMIKTQPVIFFNPHYFFTNSRLANIKFFSNIRYTATFTSGFNLWVTDYYHVMQSHEVILNLYKSTGLKPYFERIDSSLHNEFEEDILSSIIKYYQCGIDKKVLSPFTKQLMILYKHKD